MELPRWATLFFCDNIARIGIGGGKSAELVLVPLLLELRQFGARMSKVAKAASQTMLST